jgi:hypothetical protein
VCAHLGGFVSLTWMAVTLIDTNMGMHQKPYQRERSLATKRGA